MSPQSELLPSPAIRQSLAERSAAAAAALQAEFSKVYPPLPKPPAGLLPPVRLRGRPRNGLDGFSVGAILDLALERPELGQDRAALALAERGVYARPHTVYCVWKEHGLASLAARAAAAERSAELAGRELTPVQAAAVERSRVLREEHGLAAPGPGHTLALDALFAGRLADGSRVCVQTVIDVWSRLAFCRAHLDLGPDGNAEAGAKLLYSVVQPFMAERGLSVRQVLTDRGAGYYGGDAGGRSRFEWFLEQMGWRHVRTNSRNPHANVVCGRFHAAVLREFFRPALAGGACGSVGELEAGLAGWLTEYNTVRSGSDRHGGGGVPMERFAAGVAEAAEAPPPAPPPGA